MASSTETKRSSQAGKIHACCFWRKSCFLPFGLPVADASAQQVTAERVKALITRGVSDATAGQLDKALADTRHAILLSPQNAEAEHSLGIVYAVNSQPAQAEAEFKKAIARYPPSTPKTPKPTSTEVSRSPSKATAPPSRT